jgi:hypothetical protein
VNPYELRTVTIDELKSEIEKVGIKLFAINVHLFGFRLLFRKGKRIVSEASSCRVPDHLANLEAPVSAALKESERWTRMLVCSSHVRSPHLTRQSENVLSELMSLAGPLPISVKSVNGTRNMAYPLKSAILVARGFSVNFATGGKIWNAGQKEGVGSRFQLRCM